MDFTALFIAVDDFCLWFDGALRQLYLETNNSDERGRLRRQPCLHLLTKFKKNMKTALHKSKVKLDDFQRYDVDSQQLFV